MVPDYQVQCRLLVRQHVHPSAQHAGHDLTERVRHQDVLLAQLIANPGGHVRTAILGHPAGGELGEGGADVHASALPRGLLRRLDLGHLGGRELAAGRRAGLPALLELAGARGLDADDEELRPIGVLDDVAAGLHHGLASHFLAGVDQLGEVVAGVDPELLLVELLLEAVGHLGESQGGEEHPAGAGGVAVRVLPGPGGDDHRLVQVALAVEQPQDDVGPVDLGVDVELTLVAGAFAIGRVLVVLLVDAPPGRLPVRGVCLVPGEHVADTLGILALARDAG